MLSLVMYLTQMTMGYNNSSSSEELKGKIIDVIEVINLVIRLFVFLK